MNTVMQGMVVFPVKLIISTNIKSQSHDIWLLNNLQPKYAQSEFHLLNTLVIFSTNFDQNQ